MTDAESRYTQIEKETLAVTWACERFATYVQGKTIILETDHKPLNTWTACHQELYASA